MNIGITKKFCSCFDEVVRKDSIVGEATIKALLNLRNENRLNGLNVEDIKASIFKSARVTRDYRIIFYQEKDVAYLLYLGKHREAYNWAENNNTIHYHDYFVGYWDSNDYDENINEDDVCEEYNGFDKKFQKRLALCKNAQELLKICDGLAPEYREVIYSRNSINNILENYSSEILVAESDKELEEALTKPFEEWMVFLHPIQKRIIEYPSNENLCIVGGPGTGKTVSLVHRLVNFLQSGKKCILLSKGETAVSVVRNMVSQLDENIVLNAFYMDDINEDNIHSLFKTYDYFFFDELQDINKNECKVLIKAFKESNKRFTAAYDLNQAIYTTKNKKEIYEFVDLAGQPIILNYNYRCTSEIFEAAANFIKYQYDRIKQETFDMDFGLIGDDVIMENKNDLYLDFEIEDYVFEKNLLNSGDWAIIFVSYYNTNQYEKVKRKYPDNVFNIFECKGMDFKSGCVVIYNENFDYTNRENFKEFNAQSYVAITRFRDSVRIMRVFKKYESTPQKIIADIHSNKIDSNNRKRSNSDKYWELKKSKRAKEKKLKLKIKEYDRNY